MAKHVQIHMDTYTINVYGSTHQNEVNVRKLKHMSRDMRFPTM